jgi:hypothetical protein
MAWREDANITKLRVKDLTITNTITSAATLTSTGAIVSANSTATRFSIGASALELPTSATFTFTAGAANVANILITPVNSAGTTIARVLPLTVYLSDASTGVGLTGTTASGTVQAKAASGTDLGALTAKKALAVMTLASGLYTLEITATAKTGFYVCVILPCGLVVVSRVMTATDYG